MACAVTTRCLPSVKTKPLWPQMGKEASQSFGPQAWVQQLHDSNIAWVPITDPGILVDPEYDAYNKGIAADVFIKLGAEGPYTGKARSFCH